MRKWMLAAGAAALATTAPALADPKDGKGGDKGGQQAQKGGGHVKANRAGGDVKVHGQGGKAFKAEQRGSNKAFRAEAKAAQKDSRSDARSFAKSVKQDKDWKDRDGVRVRDLNDNDGFVRRWGQHGFARGFVDGCPPGLAKKDNDCLPPGHANGLVGSVFPTAYRSRSLIGPYRDWYRDDDRYLYRMGQEGFIYRVNRSNSLIDALIPSSLKDFGYYPVGMSYPQPYNFYNVPMQYSSYWPDNDDYNYRYGNGAIYQVNPQTSMIQSIVALLAGDLSVGQQLPMGYSAYNVPYAYREQYHDTPNDWYRYNDGYIYQVDPTTQLITSVIRALV